jgi:hypothetical protein
VPFNRLFKLISYILQTSPIFRFSISNLANGQERHGKLYLARISSVPEYFKALAKVVEEPIRLFGEWEDAVGRL